MGSPIRMHIVNYASELEAVVALMHYNRFLILITVKLVFHGGKVEFIECGLQRFGCGRVPAHGGEVGCLGIIPH
ncbi:hypothetical protein SAMN05216323_100447 [Williamwhitmania taraxaci]|uniref:Uncharacterized protein n=1 Tax=Williamwhitmania taraxaci TaxID=1640674 RepID=A0A1G6GVL3_9BACT|nr:hypothetical protein SAMN05216323_100447 [Williamwhitmania taraxaci]